MDEEGGGAGEWVMVRRTSEKDFWKPTRWNEFMDEGEGSDSLKITFRDPAKHWTDALPIGNGRFGAMIWGGVESELLNLNEDTLWTGGPGNYTNPKSPEALAKVRQLVDDGKYAEATAFATAQLSGKQAQTYQPLGDLKLDFDASHSTYTKETYTRELDLDTATVTLHYSIGTTDFTREYFASYPDQIIVTRISSNKPASVSFTASLSSELTHNTSLIKGKNQIVMKASCRGLNNNNNNASSNDQGVGASSVLDTKIGGSGGIIRSLKEEKKLRVENCDWAVLILAAATNFDGPFTNPSQSKKDPTSMALNTVTRVTNRSYTDLYSRHLDDYQALFHRISLQLAKPTKNNTSSTSSATTAERVQSFPTDEDPSLITLMFHYGRYLLISSSRPGTQPTNLQGIWSKGLYPPWACAPHPNINLQMNYWPSLPCNLTEFQRPLFDFIQTLSINGAKTAKINYECAGWVTHQVTDIWGKSDPDFGEAQWAQWPMGGAWLATHLWEHYTYTMDNNFLHQVAYPIIKGSAQFLLDWLIPGRDGTYLETNPSTSPEHDFTAPDGKRACVSYSTTMDMEIIREIFSIVLSASQILGKSGDEEIVQRIVKAGARLPPVKISRDGSLMEWAQDFADPDEHNRHISHLFGVYPGHTITPDKNHDLCKAAEKSLHKRGEEGPGWSTVWKAAVWARLRSSDHAYAMLKRLFVLVDPDREAHFEGGVYANLFTAHPPFQIDANFGFCAALAEMVVQSTVRDLYLLPALPRGKWETGCVKGFKARGGVNVSLCWEEGDMREVGVWSDLRGLNSVKMLHYGGKMTEVEIKPGKIHIFDNRLNCVRTAALP